jgi:energy-coupling factor transporter transmembrane protein EcfT
VVVHDRIWLVFLVCLYLALLMADWWWLILVALIGVTINYCGWSVERVQHRFRVVFSAVLGGFTLVVLAVAGWLVLHTISVPLDSVGDRRAVCGTVLNPLPADQLRATESRSGEPTLEAEQVSTIRLQQICDRRIRYWAGDLPGVLIVALLLSSRAAVHLTVRRPA